MSNHRSQEGHIAKSRLFNIVPTPPMLLTIVRIYANSRFTWSGTSSNSPYPIGMWSCVRHRSRTWYIFSSILQLSVWDHCDYISTKSVFSDAKLLYLCFMILWKSFQLNEKNWSRLQWYYVVVCKSSICTIPHPRVFSRFYTERKRTSFPRWSLSPHWTIVGAQIGMIPYTMHHHRSPKDAPHWTTSSYSLLS